MNKFLGKLIIFVLLITSPFIIFAYNKRIENIETKKMNEIIKEVSKNSIVCEKIIKLYDKSPDNTFYNLSPSIKEKILNLYYYEFYKNQVFIMSEIEKMLKSNQKDSYMILNNLGDKSYNTTYSYNIPKGNGSYYYFKAQKDLLEHILYVYNKSGYEERKKLLLQFYRYYLPFNSGYQRALDDVFND